jgi:anti-sigma regulatory factor (Ser/Thr protein kinase)
MTSTLPEREQIGDDPAERKRLRVEDDERGWRLVASEAREAARLRRTFRRYLERNGHPASDFHAAETVYGELVNNCAQHAPGEIRVEFRWEDRTLDVVDSVDRLRSWPFSPEDTSAESTHHAYALISGLTARVHLHRDPSGGTRASVVLPVKPAQG